jgi:hypothetical protein
MYNSVSESRTPRGQHNWDDWEKQVVKYAAGSFTAVQIANILTFLGSKRNSNAVNKKADSLGWKLRIVNND